MPRSNRAPRRPSPSLSTAHTLLVVLVAILASAATTLAQSAAPMEPSGVTNFGRVTDTYFRGGKVTPDGVRSLARMGVKTIIDLRDDPSPGEPEACSEAGIRYLKVPMDNHATPDPAVVDEILSIIRQSKEPVYVHCSAGKHRAGTIAALYRIREQGWPLERAWAEQGSYGFGFPEEHPELFAFVYGADFDTSASGTARAAATPSHHPAATQTVGAAVGPAPVAYLDPAVRRISIYEAIARARAAGGTGDVYKIDLEYDAERIRATIDVTFADGSEYELDAANGRHLDTKQKSPAKMAILSPLDVESLTNGSWNSFDDIIAIAQKATGRNVIEMEVKQVRGRERTVYEVVVSGDDTHYFDARTGRAVETM